MEHMCTRCARVFLQRSRLPLRPGPPLQLRLLSSNSPRLAEGWHDLSGPSESSNDSKKPPSTASQPQAPPHKTLRPSTDVQPPQQETQNSGPTIRRTTRHVPKAPAAPAPRDRITRKPAIAPAPPDQLLRKTAAAPASPGQLLRKTGGRAPPSRVSGKAAPVRGAPGKMMPSSRQQADTLRQNRAALLPRRPPPAQEEMEEEEDEEMEQEEDEEEQTPEDEITMLKEELSQRSADWNDAQILAMQSRLRLLAEHESLSDDQIYMLEQLSEPETLNVLSEAQVNSMIDRLDAMDGSESSSPATVQAEIAYLTGQLSENNAAQWNSTQILAMQSRLALLLNNDMPHEARAILEDLSTPETLNNLSDAEVGSKIEELKVLLPQDLSTLSGASSASQPAGVSDYSFDTSTEDKREALEKIADENFSSLSEDEKFAAANNLDIIASDGTILPPADAHKRFLVKQLLDGTKILSDPERIFINSFLGLVNQDGTLVSPREKYAHLLKPFDPTAAEDSDPSTEAIRDPSAEYEISIPDHERFLLSQLSPANITSLSNEEVLNIASQLNLLGPNNEILDPTQYPFSRSDWSDSDLVEIDESENETFDNDEDSDEAKMQRHIETVIDPSPIPTEPVAYVPNETSTEDLRLDWPNTPLSPEGLTETVLQKVSWLAKRLPHGHWTPSQIAERYADGYLVHFTSDAEKEMVLKLAAEIANAAAEKQSSRTGEAVDPADMQYSGIADNEKKAVMDSMARGVYPVAGKQSRQVLDGVMRQLGNNESYREEDSKVFVGRVEKLIAQISGRAQAAKKEEGAKKE